MQFYHIFGYIYIDHIKENNFVVENRKKKYNFKFQISIF